MNTVLKALIAAKEKISPVVELKEQMLEMEARGELTTRKLLLMTGQIEKTLDRTEKLERAVRRSLSALKESNAIPDKHVPMGF